MPTVPCSRAIIGLPATLAYPWAIPTADSSCRQVRNSGRRLPPWLTMDSCSPSKLDPQFDAQYSMSRVRSTSTMWSEPGRSTR